MTIPFDAKKYRFRVTVFDNYYTGDNHEPKVLHQEAFETEAAAKQRAASIKANPPFKLSEDQVVHSNDIHVVVERVDDIISDKTWNKA